MSKFYKCKLEEVEDPIKEAYPHLEKGVITFEERLGDGTCEDCGASNWMFLPEESSAVREGGKPYIECLDCGHVTHL